MNKELIASLTAASTELKHRKPTVCQEFNAALMIEGAVNLLAEADEGRAAAPPSNTVEFTTQVGPTTGDGVNLEVEMLVGAKDEEKFGKKK